MSGSEAPLSVDPADYVMTPAGLYHRSCVHEVESEARVDGGTVARRDGTTYGLAECAFPARRTLGATSPPPPADSGWVEDSIWQIGSGNWITRMTANWTVPPKPGEAYANANQVFYLFPALVPSGQLVGEIIQPVLQYSEQATNTWQIASWECVGSSCAHSTPITVSPGDVLFGSMVATGCNASGVCNWTITTRDVTTGQSTTLSYVGTAVYNIAYGGALEVYNLDSCAEFPGNGSTTMSNIALYDQNGAALTPSFRTQTNSESPSCAFGARATTTSTTLDYGVCTPGDLQSCCPYAQGCSCDGDRTCSATGKWGTCQGAGRAGYPCP
jgi:hypothetical protein